MTTIETNPYFQGLGTYDGQSSEVYYDHHTNEWSVKVFDNNTSVWIEDVNVNNIELI